MNDETALPGLARYGEDIFGAGTNPNPPEVVATDSTLLKPAARIALTGVLRHHQSGTGLLLGILLMLALTGLPRLSLTLAEYFNSSPTQETLLAKRPLFFDKVSSSQFTLARPEDSAMPWARRLAPEADQARPERSAAIVVMPRSQRTLVTAAFWNHSNFV